jgi:hypothetical protein
LSNLIWSEIIFAVIGAFLLPIGLFLFAWTSSLSLPWAPQAIARIPMGMGIIMTFMQCLNYIINTYKVNANSAISANVLVRSIVGGASSMFAESLYGRLGINWGTSLLGFLTVIMIPVPIVFFLKGKKISGVNGARDNSWKRVGFLRVLEVLRKLLISYWTSVPRWK